MATLIDLILNPESEKRGGVFLRIDHRGVWLNLYIPE
jgi:hypothetical protein